MRPRASISACKCACSLSDFRIDVLVARVVKSEATSLAKREESLDNVARLIAKIFQRDLDPFIIHLLILGPKLVATVGGAMEELGHGRDGRLTRTFDSRRAAHVDHTVEIEVVDI